MLWKREKKFIPSRYYIKLYKVVKPPLPPSLLHCGTFTEVQDLSTSSTLADLKMCERSTIAKNHCAILLRDVPDSVKPQRH